MLYLLDANVLITANRLYYPIERVPEFWDWLLHHGTQGNVKVPAEIAEEAREGSDTLADWLSDRDHLNALQLQEDADVGLVQQVIERGYAPDLSDEEVEIMGRDPFLISYALKAPNERCIVTTEVSKPTKRRANRHVPDVCNAVGVSCTDSFDLIRVLNFSTSWRIAIAHAPGSTASRRRRPHIRRFRSHNRST